MTEKITKLEKNSSKLELPNKNCSYTYMTSLFAEQPNLRLKLAAALYKMVLKLGRPNSTSIAVTLLNLGCLKKCLDCGRNTHVKFDGAFYLYTYAVISCHVDRYLTNHHLILQPPRGQDVEWAFCFDVHLNAFFPLLMILHLFQLPFLNGMCLTSFQSLQITQISK